MNELNIFVAAWIGSGLLCAILEFQVSWKKGEDITLGDVISTITFCLLFGGFMIVIILDEKLNEVVLIKGKKRDED